MVVEPGERLPDRPGIRIVLLADAEGLCATHYRFEREAGPQPHLHRLHADCFLVLEGAMRLQLAGEEQLVEPESWIQVPRGVVHAFASTTDGVTFLNVHAPPCGFGSYLRGLTTARDEDELRRVRDAFDQHPAPEDGGLDPAGAVVCRLGGGDGETIAERPGRRVTLLADTEELAATESVYGPGESGPDLHVHREHTDAWLVLEGALTFELKDGRSFAAGAGTFVAVPPHVAHGFANDGETTARFVNLHAPSCGFGEYLRAVRADTADVDLDMLVGEVAARHPEPAIG